MYLYVTSCPSITSSTSGVANNAILNIGDEITIKSVTANDSTYSGQKYTKISGLTHGYSNDGKTFYTDCLDEANILKDIIVSKLNNKNIDIELVYIGQMIGASVGPGMAGIYFWGVPETYNLEEK